MNTENINAMQVGEVKQVGGSFRAIATPLVARGIPVIPIPPRQKGANLKSWQTLATTKLEQIEEWHSENPQYNVGAVAKLDGFWMLDVDAPELQQAIQDETGQVFPETFTVASNKGMHFYFKHTAASQSLGKNIQLKDKTGNVRCDIKVHNSYVVAPGSIHPCGKPYEVLNNADIVEAPDWLVTWIKTQHQHAEADQEQADLNEPKVKEGGRNTFLFARVCKLRTSSLSKSEALIALGAINKDTCLPPLEETELSKIVESAYSYKPTDNADLPSHTDLGNAQRLVAAEGKDIKHCYKNKSWYVWDDTKWSKDENGEIQRRAKKTVKAMLHEAADLDDKECKTLVAHEQTSESEARLNSMVSLARSEKGVSVQLTDFDTDPMLFNCMNCTIDLNTGNPREHRRVDLISKIAPFKYDAKAECPTWQGFLSTVTEGNGELMDYLQRCVGYSLTGQTIEHALFLLYGNGANGKSTFLEVLRHVFGDYSQTADFGSFLFSTGQPVRNDLAKLNGARFVTASESDSSRRFDETVIKQMTGGDTITARFLYGEHFEFAPQFKLWLGTNHKPPIRGQDEGVWRRFRLIPFTVSIPPDKQDHALKSKLMLEASGILNWALDGLAQWQAKGLQEPEIVKDSTKEYRENQDAIGQFLTAECLVGKHFKSPARSLYNTYKGWATLTGEYELSERAFSNVLGERGFKKTRDGSGMWWNGVTAIPEENFK